MSTNQIFTTGAFLEPKKIIENGVEKWVWVAVEFVDDSYKNGEIFNPKEEAENLEKLEIENTVNDQTL
jgi:hypothetical protein